jgi:anti-sigma regulatory factor (Ser/Thr protein kinase)
VQQTTGDFHHSAHFYADRDELLAGTIPFVRSGLEQNEAVMVAMPHANASPLREALGNDADEVDWLEMEEVGRNPARIIPVWREFASANLGGGRGARGIGEPIWRGRTADELEECDRYESLLNLAFAGHGTWALMCPYNKAELSDEVLEHAEQNHPYVSHEGTLGSSGRFLDPSQRSDLLAGSLSVPPATATSLAFPRQRGLGGLRRTVARQAEAAGLGPSRVADLVLAVDEVATNALEHSSGGELRVWRDGGEIVCEVTAASPIADPLVGRSRPDPNAPRGRGLWIVNQLCDLVQIRSRERTVVRMRMAVPGWARAKASVPELV